MLKRVIPIIAFIVFFLGTSHYAQNNPKPDNLRVPGYDYTEPNSCTACHFSRGVAGDHMLEAVGVKFDDTTRVFSLTGSGWYSAKHSRSNYRTTQNTFCAKCHSPLQAKPEATFNKGVFKNTEQIPDGKVEGVVCASCHPTSSAAKVLGRRVGIYRYGMDRTKPEAYEVIEEGKEDKLCLNCHIEKHNTNNPAFKAMYEIGVRCIDCHMAPYGKTNNGQGTVEKRFHDFKVAMNLPFSCGTKGAIPGFTCHSEFSVESTLKLIPYLKQQHKKWWPLNPGADKTEEARKLETAQDYYKLWLELEAETSNK